MALLLPLAAGLWILGMTALLHDLWVPRGLTDVRYRTLTVLALASLALACYAALREDYLSGGLFGAFVVAVILVAHARFLAYRRARLARERAWLVAAIQAGGPAGGVPAGPLAPPARPLAEVDPREIARVEAAARAEIQAGKGPMARMFGY